MCVCGERERDREREGDAEQGDRVTSISKTAALMILNLRIH